MRATAQLCLLLILLCLHEATWAEELLSENDFLGDVPTVLTVSRLAQPLNEAPAAVTVIDRETIHAAGIVDIADVFRLVPGMYVGQNAGYLHTVNPVVSYHGMTDAYSRRMQVLIDGRTVYQPLYGGVQWSDLPLTVDDIARIEVTRGPNAASHGANAFLGIINIVTLHASETLGTHITATSGNDRHEVIARHGGKLGDMQYRMSVGYRQDDGLPERADEKHITLLNLRADWRLTDRDELEFQFGYNGGSREEGGVEDRLLFLPRAKDVNSHFEMVRWRRSLSQDSDFSVQAYHSYDRSTDDVLSTDLTDFLAPLIKKINKAVEPDVQLLSPRIAIDNDVTTERYDIEMQHSLAPLPSLRAVWGGGLRLDQATAPMYLGKDDTDSFHLARLFGHLEWHPIDRLTLNAGAMVERNDLTGTDFSPRASANFELTPGHTLRIGMSRATRTPTYLEEKFRTRIVAPTTNPAITILQQTFYDKGGLDPERILSREIGYLGSFGPLRLDTRLFYDHITDMIGGYTVKPFPVPAGYVPTSSSSSAYRNYGDITVRGFEAQGQLRLGTHTRIIANYSHVRIDTEPGPLSPGTSGDLKRFNSLNESMPVDSYSVLAWHKFGADWTASLAYYQSGEAKMPGDGNRVDLARHWDGRIARNFRLGNTQAEISLVAQNLFNQTYNEFATYNSMERRTFMQLQLDF